MNTISSRGEIHHTKNHTHNHISSRMAKTQSLSISQNQNHLHSRFQNNHSSSNTHSSSKKQKKGCFKSLCPPFTSSYANEIHQWNESQRKFMIKIACLTVIAQKVCLILLIVILLLDEQRLKYSELAEIYPMGDEGNNKFTGNSFLVIFQFLIGMALLFSSFCMIHKGSRCTSFLLPWFCTVGLLLELPIKPVLP